MADPQTTLSYMREQCQDLAIKINTMDLDKTEHELVIKALEPLDPARKCFRMIGNVVVERTVAEVLPAVRKNKDQIAKTMEGFTEMMAAKQKEADAYANEHKITETKGAAPKAAAPVDEGASQGVLI